MNLSDLFGEDQYDTPVCKLPVIEWNYHDDDTLTPGEPYPCDGEVYTVWTFNVPLIRGEASAPEDVTKHAVSSSWELRCSNGHVFADSSNLRTTHDNAERFDPSIVLGQS